MARAARPVRTSPGRLDPDRRTDGSPALRRARYASPRPTDDADAVLDIKANPQILLEVTTALTDLELVADGITPEGKQHRWRRDRAAIDVLIPDNVGKRLARRTGVTGCRTIQTLAAFKRCTGARLSRSTSRAVGATLRAPAW